MSGLNCANGANQVFLHLKSHWSVTFHNVSSISFLFLDFSIDTHSFILSIIHESIEPTERIRYKVKIKLKSSFGLVKYSERIISDHNEFGDFCYKSNRNSILREIKSNFHSFNSNQVLILYVLICRMHKWTRLYF